MLEDGINPAVAMEEAGYSSTEAYKKQYKKDKLKDEEIGQLIFHKLSMLLNNEDPSIALKAVEVGLKYFGRDRGEETEEYYDMNALQKAIEESRRVHG